MFRNAWFQIHWFIGISAGIVLALVGSTGGILSFEHDLQRLVNPGVMTVTPRAEPALEPQALLERLQIAAPERRIQALSLSSDPADAARVTFAPVNPDERRGENRYVDPYTGELLGAVQGERFFRTVRELHRWLLADDVGKQIVGASTVTLIVLCATGLYLRWPRRARDWRVWLLFNPRKQGRSFLWDLHSVLGTWVLPFYLLAAVTGLYWSYDWYRDGLHAMSGVPRQERPSAAQQARDVATARGMHGAAAADMDAERIAIAAQVTAAWQRFDTVVNDYSVVTLRLPSEAGQTIEFTYQDPSPPHARANNRITFDAATGSVVQHERYADKPLNAQLMGSMLPLHSAEFFGITAQVLMMLASFAMPVFAVSGWMLYLDRRRKNAAKRSVVASSGNAQPVAIDGGNALATAQQWLIAFASQSGVAERFAWQAAGALQAAGAPVRVAALGDIDVPALTRCQRALFVVSTFGDGEPPDNARAFARRIMPAALPLTGLRFGLLALGDRNYKEFCGFGRSVAAWLRSQGAHALFQPVEMDRDDALAMQDWQRQLTGLTGAAPDADAGFASWRLVERRLLNAGSVGQPTYHIELVPVDASQLQWQAGDIAELRVATAAGDTVREYSVASLPADGSLHLLVRQARRDDGSLGLGSALLTVATQPGQELELRIRSNRNFHAPADDRPLLLVGNGTGMAGLRVHLKARAAAGRQRNWLVFGERHARCDYYYADEIERWAEMGIIARVDTAFSRDQAPRVYVQDRLRAAGDAVRRWVAEGGAIYVCGSRNGMADGVDAALGEILGRELRAALEESGRYRKDVY